MKTLFGIWYNIWYNILYFFDKNSRDIWKEKNFEKLPNSLKRVAVAIDVIVQLSFEKYNACMGHYVRYIEIGKKEFHDPIDIKKEENLNIKHSFDKIDRCTVCAIGACVMSITRFKNKLRLSDLLDSYSFSDIESDVLKMLTSIFDPYQLALIECTFEGSYNNSESHRVGKQYCVTLEEIDEARCERFSNSYSNSKDLLISIMENIIKNKGTFKP